MLGAAIAAGASLISGIFGRNDAKKQAKKEEKAIREANAAATRAAEDMNRTVRARADAAALVPVQTERESVSEGSVDMAGFMAAAEQNGFNPLTFLRSGALSLFARTHTNDWTCTTGERAMEAAIQGQHIPQLSPVIAQTQVPGMGTVFGNALTSGANQYLSDLSQQQNNQFQMDLVRAQLGGIDRSGSGTGRSGYVPQAFMAGSITSQGGSSVSSPAEIPGMFVDVRDNNPRSNTYGQVFQVPNPDYMSSPEAFATPPLVRGRLDDPVTVQIDGAAKQAWDYLVRSSQSVLAPTAPRSGFRYPTRPGQQNRYGPGGHL